MKTVSKKAFTLVELIVTVVILAILATIGFISLIDYLSSARDSVRIQDMDSIESVLEYSKLQSGRYPDPDGATNITYSGAVVWKQGTFGSGTQRYTKGISKVPTDPQLGNEYAYSLNSYGTEFQIGGATENIVAANNVFNESYADASIMTSYIKGNYNGVGTKVKDGNSFQIFALPSIMASNISNPDLVSILLARYLSYDNSSKCLPHSYEQTQDCLTLVNSSKILAYSGSTSSELSLSQAARVTLAKNIQNAYATSDIESNDVLSKLTSTTILESSPSSAAAILSDEVTEFLFDINISDNSTVVATTETSTLTEVFSPTSGYTDNWDTNICGTPELIDVTPANANDRIRTLVSNKVYSLAAGTYTMEGPINMDDCTALIGDGEVIIQSDSYQAAMVNISSKTNTIIDNIIIDGENYSGGTHVPNLSGIDLYSSSSTISNVLVKNNQIYGVNIHNSNYTTLSDTIVTSTIGTTGGDEGYGVYLINSNNNYLVDIKSYGNDGINTTSGYGMYLNNSDENYLNNIAVFNNHRFGLLIGTTSTNNAFNNVASFNNDFYGMRVDASAGENNMFNNVAGYKNSSFQFVANKINSIVHDGFFYGEAPGGLYSVSSTQYYGTVKSVGYTGNFSAGTDGALISLFGSAEAITTLGEGSPLTADWVIEPSTSGWNVDADGKQSVTFDGTEIFSYGANFQNQVQPIKYNGSAFVSYGIDGTDFDSTQKITQKSGGVVGGGASGYDIFLIAGQSNTHYGSAGYDSGLDSGGSDIKQWGRFSPNNNVVTDITSGLEHWTEEPTKIGFGVSFAKEYITDGRLESGQKILLIPSGYGSTSFSENHWNQGDVQYNDAITRVNTALASNPGSSFEGVLWHQGERDASLTQTKAAYKAAFQSMISDMRTDISGASANTPFVLGGMVPSWIDSHTVSPFTADQIEDAHTETIADVNYTGYANGRLPTALVGDVAGGDEVHYTAASQRALGSRYYNAYESALTNN